MKPTIASSYKKVVLEIIKDSRIIKDRTTFKEQLWLYNEVSKMSESDIMSLVHMNIISERTVKKKPKLGKLAASVLKKGIFVAAVILPFGLPLYAAVQYISDMYNYKCGLECAKKSDDKDKILCYRVCDYESNKRIVEKLESELKQCRIQYIGKNRIKCTNRMYDLLEKWRNKLEDSKLELEHRRKFYYRGRLKK